jgi:glycosyltransferase involved in cell wall biosynthesis
MSRNLTVITSFFVADGAQEISAPVARALEAHASNSAVNFVQVLTESDPELVHNLCRKHIPTEKLNIHREPQRPTFARLFQAASQAVEKSGGLAAIMNADTSFANESDIQRCDTALSTAQRKLGAAVLAITRHDKVNDEWKIELYQRDGLPNTLSADCWVISAPLDLPEADFYCLGHMNCDLMLAYDLVQAGHNLFNPCLDISILHHENCAKSEDFYSFSNSKAESKKLLFKHTDIHCNKPFECIGIPWIQSNWLSLSYAPNSLFSRRERIYAIFPEAADESLLLRAMALGVFAQQNDRDLVFLVESDLDVAFHFLKPLLSNSRHVFLQKAKGSADAFLKSAMRGGLEGVENCAFTSNLYFLDQKLSDEVGAIIVDLRPDFLKGIHGFPRIDEGCLSWVSKRYQLPNAQTALTQREAACTLVTSLFKAQAYIQKFFDNSEAIYAYDEKIDHQFFVSSATESEAFALFAHFKRHPNVLIVWHRKDPGLYACWNMGCRLACTWYISNANVDDLRAPDQVWKLIEQLQNQAHISVAASALVPFEDHHKVSIETLDKSNAWYSDQGGEFGYENLARITEGEEGAQHLDPHNLPHCMPVWRRDLHAKYGYFDEATYGTFADWAFWLDVFKHGEKGYLLPEALSFYFINPGSHNRRGHQLAEWHHRIEKEHLESLYLRSLGKRILAKKRVAPAWQKKEFSKSDARKLDLHGRDFAYGQHRNSFNTIIDHMEPLHRGDDGILFLPFIERYFVWGDAEGEANSFNPAPLDRDWIGILHTPFDITNWFEPKIDPLVIFQTPLWKESFPRCRGLLTLCKDLERDLLYHYPQLPTFALLHPTCSEGKPFDLDAYMARPRVVQVGDWLRKLQAIFQIHAPNHEKVMLFKHWTRDFMEREIAAIGDFRNDSVLQRDFVGNEEYDDLLSSSVVLCLLYASAANNVLLECMARGTPIIINPLPSVLEYLGEDYPLYATTVQEAEKILQDRPRIAASVDHLRKRFASFDLSYEGFQAKIAASEFYKNL